MQSTTWQELQDLEGLFETVKYRSTDDLNEVILAFEAGYHNLLAEVPWQQSEAGLEDTENYLILRGIAHGKMIFFSSLKPKPEQRGQMVMGQGPTYTVHRDGSFSMKIQDFQWLLWLGGRVSIPA